MAGRNDNKRNPRIKVQQNRSELFQKSSNTKTTRTEVNVHPTLKKKVVETKDEKPAWGIGNLFDADPHIDGIQLFNPNPKKTKIKNKIGYVDPSKKIYDSGTGTTTDTASRATTNTNTDITKPDPNKWPNGNTKYPPWADSTNFVDVNGEATTKEAFFANSHIDPNSAYYAGDDEAKKIIEQYGKYNIQNDINASATGTETDSTQSLIDRGIIKETAGDGYNGEDADVDMILDEIEVVGSGGTNEFTADVDGYLGEESGEILESEPAEPYDFFYQGNPLMDYDAVTYNFEMIMLTARDTESAQRWILSNNQSGPNAKSFDLWTPKDDTITIAATGATVLNINSVQINATIGPIDNGKRNSGATDFHINITQPLGASFTETLVNSALQLQLPDGLKATYLLKLKFRGRHPVTGRPVPDIPQTARQFLIEITEVDATVDSSGAQYTIHAARAGDKASLQNIYTTDRALLLENLSDCNSLVKAMEEALNNNELDKLAIDKGILDEYYIHLDPIAQKHIGKDSILTTQELDDINFSDASDKSYNEEQDTGLRMFKIPQGTTIDRALEFGLAHSKKLQIMAKGFVDTADADSTDSEKIEKQAKIIFKVKLDTKKTRWDIIRNDWAREFHYTVSLFSTIRPEILKGSWDQIEHHVLMKENELLTGKDTKKDADPKKKLLTKRYDYLFTGLNDKVLRFDIKFNNQFFFAMHSYRNVFAGLEQETQTRIKDQKEKLTEFRKVRLKVEDKWQAYREVKRDNILTEDFDPEETQEWRDFKTARAELLNAYVDGINDGTFEGDPAIVENAQKYNYDPRKIEETGQTINESIGTSNDATMDKDSERLWAELLDRKQIQRNIDSHSKPFQVMWGAQPEEFRSDFDNKNRTPGMGHFHAVLESTLADFSADMVNMDMDIRGDMYWLESERDPRPYTASSYTGENYLLFRAITSAGEPDPTTGIARPGDEYKEQMLNGVYAVTEVISRFEGGQFTQNLKGVKEAFISDIDKLTNFAEVTPAIVGGNDSGSGEAPTGINRPGYSTRPANLSSLQSGQAYVDTQN